MKGTTTCILLAGLLGNCAEPLAISSYDSKIGVNWLIRPRKHRGVDYVASVGTPVLAARRGIVTRVYLKPKVGWIVRIAHFAPHWDTRYLHLDSASVVFGQIVERGQQLGKVGLFYNSAGVEHVHLELYQRTRNTAGEANNVIRDPAAEMAGCFDGSESIYDRNELTYPIPCEDSWSDETRPVESRLTASDLTLELTGLEIESIGIRGRGVVPTPVRAADITLYAGWDASLGVLADNRLRYDLTLLSGAGYAHGLFDIALLSGIGNSQVAGLVERASYVPVMLFLQVKQRRIWAQFWARAAFVLGDGIRNESGADEFAFGAQLRLPPLTKYASVLSLQYQELQGRSMLSFGVGMSFDSFVD